jgi:hypothetical protein
MGAFKGARSGMTTVPQQGIERLAAPWLNWIEQPPPKGQVAGSNPAGVTISLSINNFLSVG